MAKKRYINPEFPFQQSEEGNFVSLTRTDSRAIKSDILHILLTNKGERLYLPEFGTSLKEFIFEPYDSNTKEEIKREIKQEITKYIPNLNINEIIIDESEDERYLARVRIDYTITDDVFESKDFVEVNL